jgi:hypothetical protein
MAEDNPSQAASLECADIAQLQVEAGERALGQSVGEAFGDGELDAAQEADRQVQIPSRRPPKIWRELRAGGEVGIHLLAQRLGQRQPEERADRHPMRAGRIYSGRHLSFLEASFLLMV